jgi:hypothetical protein
MYFSLTMCACKKREIVPERIGLAFFFFVCAMQGDAFCDLPEDTMLPGEK